ncbi:hypothetical protein KIN20_009150 [Parelaphostrongylus tenuis]|uniref:Uncharacterized protein n=1 Tax=Parelaphostrongylus tenuis TaxID=148309 RepID=A0AAD5M921_PARTN|nr:hypothetical protein KIN20_009150 [Parelaphostrongylus tenuis]
MFIVEDLGEQPVGMCSSQIESTAVYAWVSKAKYDTTIGMHSRDHGRVTDISNSAEESMESLLKIGKDVNQY